MPYTDNIILNDNKYLIRGDIFDGQWVYKNMSICSAQVFTTNTQTVYSLDDYLPKDNYTYEIMLYFIGNTGAASGNAVYYWVRSGSNNLFSVRTCSVITRTASSENGAGMAILPIRPTDRNVSIYLESNCTSGNCYCGVFAYRRLGTNKWSENNIDNITDGTTTYKIGGDILPGKWTVKRVNLLSNYSIAASKGDIKSIDLSSSIPNDGYNYECIIDGAATTSATNGQYSSIRFYYPGTESYYPVQEAICRSGASQCNYFNIRIPVYASSKVLRLVNTGSSVTSINVRFEAYRRIGTNV